VPKRRRIALSKEFVPKFWDNADHRVAVVKEIRRRAARLKRDTGADSYQKEMLAERAIFVLCRLESMECDAVTQTEELDAGVYTQMVNSLAGLLNKLGLEKKVKKSGGLKAYLEEREA
jgi:histidinol-phosphate/aromatic aminotransferase/cobyric acid decarboxylase-like protein